MGELLCQGWGDYRDDEAWYVIDPTTAEELRLPEHGIRIARGEQASAAALLPIEQRQHYSVLSGDLDGDGLAELVIFNASAADGRGLAHIWRGAQLFPPG